MSSNPAPCDGVGLSPELDAELKTLAPDHKFHKWITEGMADALMFNRQAGEKIQEDRIPPHYISVYGVNNLYRYGHPEGFRSCYTLLDMEDGKICGWILDIMTHKEYERRFDYRM